MAVGILSYGSLLDDPGEELQASIAQRIDGVETPFSVEFARKSRTRGGGPTLVPVEAGGARIGASILVLQDGICEDTARDLLYRRETRKAGESISYRDAQADWIQAMPLDSLNAGLSACFVTALEPNIDPLTAPRLAELAIESAAGGAGDTRRDGISYLEEQERRGVVTPLMSAYKAEVLSRTGGTDLRDAWHRIREAGSAS